ncbi:aminoacetone oxidase family FAD-binding enzyme [bacterium]|nr:aminoacetone oxidase family FAD-binding enzyme [bacterium]
MNMKITIIGGGAAGMMAAAWASKTSPLAHVTILERNEKLGRKVVMTGGGRCNLTTGTVDVKQLMKNYPRGGEWLKFAMYDFGPKECYEYFESNGVPLKMEGNRAFPKSEKGEDIIKMFNEIFIKNKVEVLYTKVVQGVRKEGGLFVVDLDNGDSIKSDKLILTTGGNAYSKTGSRGDGYTFAKSLGHTITPLAPTLTSLNSNEIFIKSLAGVSAEKAKLKLVIGGAAERGGVARGGAGKKPEYEFTGPFLFTHTGITGPAVFAISAFSAYEKLKKGTTVYVDFVPALNRDQLRAEIEEDPKAIFTRAVSRYVTKSLAEVFGVPVGKRVNEVGKKEITRVTELLKNFPIQVTQRTPGREIVTAGGVSLKEVDKKTMESLITPGLYFAGELLDVDGLTGGYNLQIAWATGKLAGESSTS